jgi:hypothetical protein
MKDISQKNDNFVWGLLNSISGVIPVTIKSELVTLDNGNDQNTLYHFF